MKYQGTLIAVTNMEQSKQFYQEVLGMKVLEDFGANVALEGGLFLQTKDSWGDFIENKEVTLQHNAGELYFEEKDMDAFLAKLATLQVEYVHALKEHRWGQRVLRFYHPDHHIIEVGEEIEAVVKRFLDLGMSIEQVAHRMDVSEDYVKRHSSR